MRFLSGLILFFVTSWALAQENYVTAPEGVFPPGCATITEFGNPAVHGATEVLYSGTQSFADVSEFFYTGAKSDVSIVIYRQGCAESGRAIIKVQLEVVNGGSALVPILIAVIDGLDYPLRLTADPNSFTDAYTGTPLFEGEFYEYFLDGTAWPDLPDYLQEGLGIMTPEQYNSAFQLDFVDYIDFTTTSVDIPAYSNNLTSMMMPFNGRLSGNWVVFGVPDQGFVLAFEELPDGTNFVFVSWYTFASDGTLLWLTAGDTYEIGDNSIQLEIELVTNGQFLGNQAADRSVVGSATLSAYHCNHLQLEFDLSSLGLGTGSVRLQRLFSLETAGYACRDPIERADTIGD